MPVAQTPLHCQPGPLSYRGDFCWAVSRARPVGLGRTTVHTSRWRRGPLLGACLGDSPGNLPKPLPLGLCPEMLTLAPGWG